MSIKYKELLQLYPYKTTVVHKETDSEARLNFKNWYLHGGNAGEIYTTFAQKSFV
jgi:hypothetical protein